MFCFGAQVTGNVLVHLRLRDFDTRTPDTARVRPTRPRQADPPASGRPARVRPTRPRQADFQWICIGQRMCSSEHLEIRLEWCTNLCPPCLLEWCTNLFPIHEEESGRKGQLVHKACVGTAGSLFFGIIVHVSCIVEWPHSSTVLVEVLIGELVLAA